MLIQHGNVTRAGRLILESKDSVGKKKNLHLQEYDPVDSRS